MIPLLTAARVQAIDRETEERGTPVETLMERAGHAVAAAAVRLAGGAYGRRGVVVCGKGNNGGDGLVAARRMARSGMGVTVVLLAQPDELRGPVAENMRRLDGTSVRVLPAGSTETVLGRELGRCDVAIDAIFGTGFRGAPEGVQAAAISAMNQAARPVVAVDVPSGVDADTGLVRGDSVLAAATVTFGAPKAGIVFHPGALRAGEIVVADIGFPAELLRGGDLLLVEREDAARLLPRREPRDHKRSSGVVLVVAGSRRMPGAARLVARGAARAGAGLVTVAVPASALGPVQAGVAEATFLPLPEGPAGSVSPDAWDVLSERLGSFDALAVGPGLSTDEGTPELVRRLLRECPVPIVADADALNAFAGRAGELAARASSEAVLTPHEGELSRLFGMPASELAEDRPGFARKAAAETRAVVVLKGPRTLVALPDGEVRVNPTGSPALATGGTGDVLTGAVAALLARGLRAAGAATAGVFVHGRAGELAGEDLGEGTTATDVADRLPAAIREALP